MYNFELKPDNKIESLSLAVSQAVNYKGRANYTYVVLPNISEVTFHDTERLSDFKIMCMENNIGLLSVEMEYDEAKEIITVLDAEKTELLDYTDLEDILLKYEYSYCPLCRRAVDYSKNNCGWKISEDEICMKEKLENL